jgi:hypothetical protein
MDKSTLLIGLMSLMLFSCLPKKEQKSKHFIFEIKANRLA